MKVYFPANLKGRARDYAIRIASLMSNKGKPYNIKAVGAKTRARMAAAAAKKESA